MFPFWNLIDYKYRYCLCLIQLKGLYKKESILNIQQQQHDIPLQKFASSCKILEDFKAKFLNLHPMGCWPVIHFMCFIHEVHEPISF